MTQAIIESGSELKSSRLKIDASMTDRTAGFFYVTCAAVTLVFYATVIQFTANFPQWDDFNLLLAPATAFSSGQSAYERLRAIFEMHDVHFHVISRLIFLSGSVVFGQLNFSFVILCGSLGLILAFWLLVQSWNGTRAIDRAAVMAVLLLVFQPVHYEALRASTAWPYLWMHVFVLAGIRTACRGALLAPVFYFLTAWFSASNGALLALVYAIVYWRGKRTWSILWISAFFSIAVWHYSLQQTQGMVEARPLATPLILADYFLSLTGASFGFLHHWPSLLAGTLLTALACILALKKVQTRQPRLCAYLLFLYLTVAVNTLGRAAVGVQLAYTVSRYSIYSSLIAAVTLILLRAELCSLRLNKRTNLALISGAVLYCLTSYTIFLPWYRMNHQSVLDSAVSWQATGSGLLFYYPDIAPAIMEHAARAGVFVADTRSDTWQHPFEPQTKVPLGNRHIYAKLEHFDTGRDAMVLRGWALVKDFEMKNAQIWLEFASKEQRVFFLPERRVRPDVDRHHRMCCSMKGTKHSGFFLLTKRESLPRDPYTVKLHIIYAGRRSTKVLLEESSSIASRILQSPKNWNTG